nr:9160_t:CDS:2 [Entrophospora candida]
MTAKKLKASIHGYERKFVEAKNARRGCIVEADEHDEYIKSKPSSKKHKEKFETDEQEEHIKSKSSSEKGKEKSELDGQDLELMAEINSQEKTETDDQAKRRRHNDSSAAKSVPHNCLFFFDSPEPMNSSNMVLSSLMAQCIMNVLKKSHLMLTTVATDCSTVRYYEHDEAIDIWSFGIVNYMLSKKNIHGILMIM